MTLNSRTLDYLADKQAPKIAERLVARPCPGDMDADRGDLLTEVEAAAT